MEGYGITNVASDQEEDVAIGFLRYGSLLKKKTENLAEISTLASSIFPRHMTLYGEKECGSY